MTNFSFQTFSDLHKDAFNRSFIGWDSLVNNIHETHKFVETQTGNFPPYSISKPSENSYLIEMALAGYSKDEIEIEFVPNSLTVRGKTRDQDQKNYLFKSIAKRAFERKFAIGDHIEVKNAAMENGFLTIELLRVLPEALKPRVIEINAAALPARQTQYLTEAD